VMVVAIFVDSRFIQLVDDRGAGMCIHNELNEVYGEERGVRMTLMQKWMIFFFFFCGGREEEEE
jgi:hypothetical protein